MLKVDVPQILISSAAIFGILLLWHDLTIKAYDTIINLLSAAFIDKDGEERRRIEEEEEIRRKG